MEQDFHCHKEKVYQQVQEQYGKLVYTYTCHLKMAANLQTKASAFKWAQIILSAISTGGFFTTVASGQSIGAWVGGIFSTLLLVVNGYLKDKKFAVEQQNHINTANELWVVREEYLSFMTDYEELSEEDIVKMRDGLMIKTAQIYKSAPQTNEKAYRDAQKALKDNEEQFFTQKELNVMLPSHLRK